MAYEIVPSHQVKSYLKKLKERELKQAFITIIYDLIATTPTAGHQKKGDLAGIYVQSLKYRGTQYRLAYTVVDEKLVLLLIAGTHENFYQQLRNYLSKITPIIIKKASSSSSRTEARLSNLKLRSSKSIVNSI